ncbi:2Fe-2S iron-sulfur cluster-binding protein [Saccharothrix syringae]|uniref:2Fe-2S iron-sulfur cluster binding domain-containing protein n=1 Tax=Saccharothrix syringae TaxID=103733 RepID=A0A5Q0GWR3_SACSY|nr:2Fe-2S iron-sulfur cluster-binding protein [Saccharothrix syringae]QFZ17792.1 2Fe-2S iron-sulfur cluster binding domain-containing protein [Saccharothrix syringae]
MNRATAAARTRFHPLTVVDRDTASADGASLAITLRVPTPLRELFSFTPGQHLAVRATVDGAEVRRSYSLCSPPDELTGRGTLRIGIRLLPGGVYSGHAASALVPGATVHAMPPLGAFTTSPDPARSRRYAAVVAGSGVTPVLALATAALAAEPGSTFTAVLANRTADSTMFAEQLADLKDRYPARFALTRLFSRERLDVGLAATHLDDAALDGLLTTLLPPHQVDEWFTCGPAGVVDRVRRALAGRGVPAEAVHAELFHAAPAPPPATTGGDRALTVRLDGRSTRVDTDAGTALLDAALTARPELPYSCRTGVCGTCRVRVVEGEVRMPGSLALDERERAAGYALACLATPLSERVTIDFDVV